MANGSSVLAWDTSWIPDMPNFKLVSHLFPGRSKYVINEFVKKDGLGWNMALLHILLTEFECKAIESFSISISPS